MNFSSRVSEDLNHLAKFQELICDPHAVSARLMGLVAFELLGSCSNASGKTGQRVVYGIGQLL